MKKYLLIFTIIAAPWYLSAQTMDIGTGTVTTIGVGASMNIGTAASPGDVTNTSNTGLIVESSSSGTGSLICSGTPNATIERYIDENAWHLVTPITDPSNASDFYLGGVDRSWLAYYDESDDSYNYIITIDTALTRPSGFSYWIETAQGAQTIQFTGTLTGADVTAALAKSSNGWNLIGNPFPSSLEWATSWSTGTSGTAYVWDNSGGGSYLYYNGTSGTLTDGIIPLGQGFLVQASSAGNFTIPSTARIHNHSNEFYKSANAVVGNLTTFIRIDLDDGYYGNTVFVGFPDFGTSNFDISGDATKLYSSTENIQFFAIENEAELCINANAPITEGESKTVPLNLVQVTDGVYTMVFSDLDQLSNISITLEDIKTGNTQDIRITPTYSFNASGNDNPERFLLHFAWSPEIIDDNDNEVDSNVKIYAYGSTIYINSKGKALNTIGELSIYDVYGRIILNQQTNGSPTESVMLNQSNSYVIVKVIVAGRVYIEKVFIK